MKNPSHILVVDDDVRILKLLQKFLQQNDFVVSTATKASDAIAIMKNFACDLIILDVMMPEKTGIDFAKDLRSAGVLMPIMMLTALSEPEERVNGLKSGASDYLTKPFDTNELLLRINNLISSHNLYKKEHNLVRFGNNTYNMTTKELLHNETNIKLSSTEQKLLDIMIENQGSVISREELSMKMGGLNLRSIDVQIVRLRGKIENDPKNPNFLKTMRNHGYILYI